MKNKYPIMQSFGSIAGGVALVLAAMLSLLALPSRADGPDQAHVVVKLGENDVAARPISFTAPISGLKALQLTGLEVITQEFAWGVGICSIGSVGCPADECFTCPAANGGSLFWNYSYWAGDQWAGYLVGATDSTVNNGAIEGWAWGSWPTNPPPAPPVTAAVKALAWLPSQQSAADGGYGSASTSVETLLSIGANRLEAANWRRQANSPSLLSYVLANGSAYANSNAGAAGKMAVGLSAANGCWPVTALKPLDYYSSTTGFFGSAFSGGSQAWAMLGTAALSQAIPAPAVDALKNAQQTNGGWEWSPGWGSDTNSTALALQALLAAGEPVAATAIISGLNYLDAAQNNDGGFPYDPTSPWGADSDANSTAYVVQSLRAAGQDPLTGTWVISASHPISYLLEMQLSDGSFEWQKGLGVNQLATQQAIPALLYRSFPLKVAHLDACQAVYLPVIFKQP